MKKFSKKKKIALSSVSVGLVAATLVTVFTLGASKDTYYSFEYIEKLKNKYEDSTMRVLEIAPSGSESVFGYLVEGSEPNKDWLKVAQMFSGKADRENYVNAEFAKLKNNGLLAPGKDQAPLELVSEYDENYPWENRNGEIPDGYKELKLDSFESVEDVKGEMHYVDDGSGAYESDKEYYLASLNFKDYFNFYTFRTILTSKVKMLDKAKSISNASTKVLAVNPGSKSIGVFGSTVKNWNDNSGYDAYYDLSAAYKSKDYYAFDVEPGYTYSLKFNATVTGGKGQVTLIPLDSRGKNIYYSPNYSKQYWYWSEYFDNSGETEEGNSSFEYQFTVSPKSDVKKVQLRFDVNDIETVLKVNSLGVYRFTDEADLLDINQFAGSARTSDTVSLTGTASTLGANGSVYKMVCEPAASYTLTYHTESKGGGIAYAKIHFYDLDGREITSIPAGNHKNSGTYKTSFQSDVNAKYLALELGTINPETGTQISAFSNISVTKDNTFEANGEAEYLQLYDHFSTGEPEEALVSLNVFDYEKWYISGSNGVNESLKKGNVTTYENGIIELDSESNANLSTRFTDGKYVQSDLLYYMGVDGGEKYTIKFRAYDNSGTAGAKADGLVVTLHYSDDNRKGLGRTEKFIVTPDKLDKDGFYNGEFITPENAHFAQISFATTAANKKLGVDYIGIYEYQRSDAFYYNLIFTEVNDPRDYPDGTAFYTLANPDDQTGNQGYTLEGVYGEDIETLDSNKTYFYYDDANDRYLKVGAFVKKGTKLYVSGAYYYWEGNYNEGDFYYDLDATHYVASINFSGYVKADSNNVSEGSPLYKKTGENTYSADPVKIYTESAGIDLKDEEYFLKVDPASNKRDKLHPYYVEVEPDGFTTECKDGEYLLFVDNEGGYTYVGSGGHYNYEDNNKENLTISTDTVFYKGEIKNNQWFKRFVLDCDRANEDELEAEMKRFNVQVVVCTPDDLNILDKTFTEDGSLSPTCELAQALDNFELVVISSGVDLDAQKRGSYLKDGKVADISDDVLNLFKDRIIAEDISDDTYLPVIVDHAVLGDGSTNINKLAEYICSKLEDKNSIKDASGKPKNKTNHQDKGNVTNYIYLYNEADIPGGAFIANRGFLKDIDESERSYEKEYCNYNEVYSSIDYENNLRELKKKFRLFDDWVSEAGMIRHILNYRGQRVVNCKTGIRILEIQPTTNASVLCADGSKAIDVRKWFDPNGEANDLVYRYFDEKGDEITGTTTFTITTTTPYELNGKIDDLAELYDLVYIGTSLDNISHLASGGGSTTEAGKNTRKITDASDPDHGDIIPDYKTDTSDGLFYISSGEKFNTSGSGLNRPDLAGYCRDDYNVVGNLWWVNTSDCELRLDGNDLTDTKMEQLKMFVDQGLPVVVSDDLCLQDYSESLSVKVMGKTFYERENKQYYLPGFEGNDDYLIQSEESSANGGANVCLTAQVIGDLPEGTEVKELQWFYHKLDGNGNPTGSDIEITKTLQKKVKFLGITLWTREINNDDYGKLDLKGGPEGKGGDGVYDTFYIDFDPKSYTENGYYFCKVKFDFSNCKNSLGASLKYNGLYGGGTTIDVHSNGVIVNKESRTYQIGIKGGQDAEIHEAVVFRVNPAQLDEYNKKSNGASHTYQALIDNGTITYENSFTPEDAGDYVAYNWQFNKSGWLFGYRWVPSEKVECTDRIYKFKAYDSDMKQNRPVFVNTIINTTSFSDDRHISNIDPCTCKGSDTYIYHQKSLTADGYRLSLTDAGFNKIQKDVNGYVYFDYVPSPGGYTLNGTDLSGEDITGPIVNPNFGAKVLDNRVDTCSNMYDFLANGFENNGNMFTQNQVERADSRYRNLLKRYVNLSEPEIEYVDEPTSYPDSLNGRSFSFSFKILNKTDVDSVNARYNYKFFVDINGDGQFSAEEACDASVSGASSISDGLKTTCEAGGTHIYTLTYNFGKDEVGIKPWKLLVTKIGEPGAHTSVSDYAYIQPASEAKAETIKAVMVLPSDWDPEYVRLQKYDSSEKVDGSADQTNSGDYFGNGKYSVLNGEKAKKGDSKYNGAYSGCIYKGSVFLNDVFVSDALKNVNETGAKLTRNIYYCKSNDTEHTKRYLWSGNTPVAMNYDEYDPTPDTGKYVYNKDKAVHHVEFILGQDYKLEIYFTNVCDMDNSYANTVSSGVLDDADMLIMGFGDMYCKQGQGKSYGVFTSIGGGTTDAGVETQGFNQNASLAIEKFLNDGLPVLFCHDTAMYNCNFVNYAINDVYSTLNSAANTVANWWTATTDAIANTWNKLWKEGKLEFKVEEVNKYNSDVHSSRLKQGYYSTLLLRDGLGLDSYGITAKIKERANYTYTDNGLKDGHNYNNIYQDSKGNGAIQYLSSTDLTGLMYLDGTLIYSKAEHDAATNGNQYKYDDMNGNPSSAKIYNEWKRAYKALETSSERERFLEKNKAYPVACNVLDLEYNGYSIAWEPGSSKLETTCFAQGFTTYAIKRFRKDASSTYSTNKATQVNKGQITTYPYDINGENITPYVTYEPGKSGVVHADSNVNIKQTHEQYFQVNLNTNADNEGATVWYCLAPSGSDDKSAEFGSVRNDCKNAYYVYTKGNATYTGAGHTNTFSIFEAKLFLNTIVASSRTGGKVPKVRFYEKDSVTIQDYIVLSGAKDENTDLTTSGDNVVEDRVFVDNDYVIWTDYLHFKISGIAATADETSHRKVSFYILEDGKEKPVTDIKAYKDQERTKPADLGDIVPNDLYYMDIPETILDSMIDDNGTVKKGEETLYIHVELTDKDKQALEERIAAGEAYGSGEIESFTYTVKANDTVAYKDSIGEDGKPTGGNVNLSAFLTEGKDKYVEASYFYDANNNLITFFTMDTDKDMLVNGKPVYKTYYITDEESEDYGAPVYFTYGEDGNVIFYIIGTEENHDKVINDKYVRTIAKPDDMETMKEQKFVYFTYDGRNGPLGVAAENNLGDAAIVISLTDLLYLR